jgi:plastocyanin
MRKALVMMTAVLAFASVACSKSSSSTTGGASGGGGGSSCTADNATALTGDLTIKDFAFHPACFSVSAGSTISVNNQDTTTHTFTSDGTDVNVSVDAGTTQTATAPAAGTYPFHCSIHPTMTGTFIVT